MADIRRSFVYNVGKLEVPANHAAQTGTWQMAQDEINEQCVPGKAADPRERLVALALEWETYLGVAPSITNAISELDAALQLVGMDEAAYCSDGQTRTAVSKHTDFIWQGVRYQVTASRPSGKRGSRVTKVSQKKETKTKLFGWDRLIWILYDCRYNMREAREFTADEYRTNFTQHIRLGPKEMKKGRQLFPA